MPLPRAQDLQESWEKVENKPQVALYGAGAVFALFLTSTVINAINGVPFVSCLTSSAAGGRFLLAARPRSMVD